MRFSIFLLLMLLGGLGIVPATAQTAPPPATRRPAPAASPASLVATYTYRGYLIYDQSAGPEPIVAEGVGGTLTLNPDGSYEKHLQLLGNKGPVQFDQRGRFILTGTDNISFDYTDAQGKPKSDLGTYRLDPEKRALELTIVGFPAGNRGVYQLTGPRK